MRDESTVPPKADELEVSIFGPGRGECVVLHLGDNEWCIIDSCMIRGRKVPVAAEYLRSLDANALSRVKLVIATHWHDDHIGGLSSLLELAPQAKFCCSIAIKYDEFRALVSAAPQNISGHSGVDELASILNNLQQRGQTAPTFAIENRAILEMEVGRPFPVKIASLSPSDPTVRLALQQISKFLPKEKQPQRRIVDLTPNHASVVLWVEAGEIRALLGADLEHTGRAGEGWVAVMSCREKHDHAHIFKVPHHGSENADHPEVWKNMLIEDPLAVVTPFAGGSVRLPKDSDLRRLAGRTSNLFCTASGFGKPPSRDAAVERNMRLNVRERRVVEGRPGHVRIRWSTRDRAAEPTVNLFNGALRIANPNPIAEPRAL